MLGKPSRRTRKRLEENGRRAPATVVSIAERGMAVTNGAEGVVSNTELMLKTTLRVEPPGEPAFEVTKRIRYPQLSVPSAGMRVNVLFDPDDHDEVIIDSSVTGAGPVKDVGALLGAVQAAQQQNAGDPMAMAAAVRASLAAQGITAAVSTSSQELPMTFGAPSPEADRLSQLEKLGKLHEQGILTDAEFQAEKQKILGS